MVRTQKVMADEQPLDTADERMWLNPQDLVERPLDGTVASVFLAKNKIFYRKAEIITQEPTPFTYMNEKNEVVKEMIGGGPVEELIPLFEETYENALQIVQAGSK